MIRCSQEAILNLVSEVTRCRGDAATIPKHSAAGGSQGNGFLERAEQYRPTVLKMETQSVLDVMVWGFSMNQRSGAVEFNGITRAVEVDRESTEELMKGLERKVVFFLSSVRGGAKRKGCLSQGTVGGSTQGNTWSC